MSSKSLLRGMLYPQVSSPYTPLPQQNTHLVPAQITPGRDISPIILLRRVSISKENETSQSVESVKDQITTAGRDSPNPTSPKPSNDELLTNLGPEYACHITATDALRFRIQGITELVELAKGFVELFDTASLAQWTETLTTSEESAKKFNTDLESLKGLLLLVHSRMKWVWEDILMRKWDLNLEELTKGNLAMIAELEKVNGELGDVGDVVRGLDKKKEIWEKLWLSLEERKRARDAELKVEGTKPDLKSESSRIPLEAFRQRIANRSGKIAITQEDSDDEQAQAGSFEYDGMY